MMAHPRLKGLFLLLVSLGFLLTLDLDKGGGILRLCGLISCFVSGWLVLIFFWNDGDITKLRRIHKEMPQRRALPATPDREWTFRYPPMKGARLVVMVCLCVFMLGMAAGSLLLLISSYENKADAATVEIAYFIFGVFSFCAIFFCWFTWRYARLFVKVDGKGITASTYFGLRNADWEGIIALRDWIPFRGLGVISNFFAAGFSLYKIYTHKHMISFSSSLPGADQLARLISETTGLDWK
jgi:hypothetical protein